MEMVYDYYFSKKNKEKKTHVPWDIKVPTAGEKLYDTLLGLWSWMTFLSATDLRCCCKVNVDPNRLGSDLPMPPDGAMQNTEPATPCTKSPGEERPRRMEGWKRWGEGGVKAA